MEIRFPSIAALIERCIASPLGSLIQSSRGATTLAPSGQTLRKNVKKLLTRAPWVWALLRWYVRYFPRALVIRGINKRVNEHFSARDHGFVVHAACGCAIGGGTKDMIQRYIYLFGIWEPNLTRWLAESLKRGDVFVDVGANIGYFSLLASKVVGETGKVASVEASPTIFEHLSANVVRNRANNIRLLNYAASNRVCKLRLFRGPAGNLGATSIFNDAGFTDEGNVEGRPLSEMLTREEAERARLIKIDVEGAEAAALEGFLPLLPITRRELELVVEVGGGPKGSPPAGEAAARIVPILRSWGFNVYRIRNDYRASAYITREPCERPQRVRHINSIADECDLVFSRRDVETL